MHDDFERQQKNDSYYTKVRRYLFYKEDLQATLDLLRHHGRAKQTHNPFWKFVHEWATTNKATYLCGPATIQGLAKELFQYEEANIDFNRKKTVKDNMLNISGAQMIHLFFLMTNNESYTTSQKERIKDLGKKLIEVSEEKSKKDVTRYINMPYASDLKVWKTTLKHIDEHVPKGDREIEKAVKAMKERLEKVHSGCKRLKKSGCIDKKKHMGLYTGETVLHFAIANADVDTVRWLIRHGADVRAKATGSFFSPASLRWGHLRKIIHNKQEKHMLTFGWRQLLPLSTNMYNPDAAAPWSNSFGAIQSTGDVIAHAAQPDLYCGQLPLALAVQIGSIMICEEIKKNTKSMYNKNHEDEPVNTPSKHGSPTKVRGKAKKQKPEGSSWSEVVKEKDDYGNTALHVAVMHSRMDAFDWLMSNGAASCITAFNDLALTPFTLAVWLGDMTMYTHIARTHLAVNVWKYGETTSLRLIDLEQIDSFRVKYSKLHGETRERKGFRSAFELMVQHEVKAFAKERIFNSLVKEKWKSFGLHSYIGFMIVPYAVNLIIYSTAAVMRAEELKTADPNVCAANLYNESGVLFILIATCGTAIQLWITYLFGNTARHPLKHDANLLQAFSNRESFMMFIYRNLGSLASLTLCCTFVAIVVARSACNRLLELQLIGAAAVILWCNFLNVLLLFKFVGTLVQTIYRMLFGDVLRFVGVLIVQQMSANHLRAAEDADRGSSTQTPALPRRPRLFAPQSTPFACPCMEASVLKPLHTLAFRFLVVYIVLLGGFAFAYYSWMQGNVIGFEGCIEDLTCPNVQIAESPAKAALVLLWSSFGDVDIMSTIDSSESYAIMLIAQLAWIVLTNVLLLNLLISMMAETFSSDQQDTHDAWLFPVARFVLMWEKKFLWETWKERYRSGVIGPPKDSDQHNGDTGDSSDSESSGDDNESDPQPNASHKTSEQEQKGFENWYRTTVDKISKSKDKRKVEHRYTSLRPGTAATDEVVQITETLEDGDRWNALPRWFRQHARRACPNGLPRMFRVSHTHMTKPMLVSSEGGCFYFEIRPSVSGPGLCLCARELMELPQVDKYHVHKTNPTIFCVDNRNQDVYCTCSDPECIQYMLTMKDQLFAAAREVYVRQAIEKQKTSQGSEQGISDYADTTPSDKADVQEDQDVWRGQCKDMLDKIDKIDKIKIRDSISPETLLVSHRNRVLSTSGQRVWLKLSDDILKHWIHNKLELETKTDKANQQKLRSEPSTPVSRSRTLAAGT